LHSSKIVLLLANIVTNLGYTVSMFMNELKMIETEERTRGDVLRDVAEILAAVLLFVVALGFLNYALVNMNTGYDWMPFVAGPLTASAFMISLIPLIFARTYRLFMLEFIIFTITTAGVYVLTYTDSTIYDYENSSLPFLIIMALVIYLHWYEGDEHFSTNIVYAIHMFIITFVFTIGVLLAFRYGSVYGITELTLMLLLSLSLYAVIIAFMSGRKMPTMMTSLFSFILWILSLIPIKFIHPDVTLWFAMAPALCVIVSSVYIPLVERWE